jgi:SAM-dependent methyltransferase
MQKGPATHFAVGDLAVFDEAHLRAIIRDVSGAVPPELAGRALSLAHAAERATLLPLAARIERALPPDRREALGRALASPIAPAEHDQARQRLLDLLFWDLTYWKTPDEYERLTAGEQVHLGALDVARVDGAVVLDAGCGTGRATLPLARRARFVYALDPAPPLLHRLDAKLAAHDLRNVELLRGTFARIPLPDDSVDAVIACSAFGPLEVRGGARGLDELRRVTRPGGRIVVLWPEDPAWFARHGLRHTVLPGRLTITFPSLADGLEAARRFYGARAVAHLERTGRPELPFGVLGVKEPRDLSWCVVRK